MTRIGLIVGLVAGLSLGIVALGAGEAATKEPTKIPSTTKIDPKVTTKVPTKKIEVKKRCGDDWDCDGHVGIARGGDDCDDGDANRYPGNVEVHDGNDHDEDCDYTTYGEVDGDEDGYFSAAACNIGPDGTRYCGSDCNDGNASIHPTQIDVLNGRDDNCNGQVDEDQTRADLLRMLGLR